MYLNFFTANWIKVFDIKLGSYAATINGWEKIISLKKVSREQVFDIEVEGTHNFLANNIVAHNTYISGNLGVGFSSPAYALDVRSLGTGIIARFNSGNSTGCSLADGGTITCSSDINLKKNIEGLTYGLDDVMKLRPVEFNWKTEDELDLKSLGFIAQEVEGVVPKLVITDSAGYKELNTIGLVPLLIKAIQEQQVKVNNSLDMLTQQIASVSAQVSAQASASAKLAKEIVEFLGNVVFKGEVEFLGRPTFNKDTAGLAIIKKDAEKVEVMFEKEYQAAPLINISITLDEATQSALEKQILEGDIKYIVTKRSTKGFAIKINKPVPSDLTFSWSALAVKDAKIAISNTLGIQLASPSASPAPTPSPQATSSAQINPLTIKINNNELGFLRIREEATAISAEKGQVLPGEIYQVLVEKDGWFKIEYKPDFYGWVKGSYITIQ